MLLPLSQKRYGNRVNRLTVLLGVGENLGSPESGVHNYYLPVNNNNTLRTLFSINCRPFCFPRTLCRQNAFFGASCFLFFFGGRLGLP